MTELNYDERRDSVASLSSEDPLYEMSDVYGQTPPRTRHSRRQRERKQGASWGETKSLSSSKEIRTKPSICRRDTLDTIIFNKMCDEADEAREKETKEEAVREGSRKCKRSLKLARGNERDLKLDVEAATHYAERTERRSAPVPCNMKVWRRVIETRNRFRCLRSKPVDIDRKKREPVPVIPPTPPTSVEETNSKNFKDRELFHDTFSFLIRLGSTDKEKNCKRQMSSEETRWQNEVKDLIWLELQAYHADRSLMAQDEYLCKQREAVGPLLTEIMYYRYNPSVLSNPSSGTSSNDSGYEGTPVIVEPTCMGCLCMRCRPCAMAQLTALKQVEGLLCRLEAAEALYPSCQAFAANYPMYKSPEFIGRVKAMCLWYNMTRHHRLKLQILGKLLMMLDSPKSSNFEVDSGISSRSSDTSDNLDPKPSTVRFELSSFEDTPTSTTDSTTSNSSSISLLQSWPSTPESSNICSMDDWRHDHLEHYLMEFDRQSYRKYIEEVLKTRGLSKSLNFLERLHTSVLRKASLTIKKWDNPEELSSTEEYEGDRELKRYGVWSPEAKALNLPSYRSAFIFLSRVPLDVVHEFLRMRLEQKPEQPGPLSVRQLMREMREGLRIACIHRDRFVEHSETVHACDDFIQNRVNKSTDSDSPIIEFSDVKDFDKSLQSSFEVYLDYLRQWVEMVQYNSFHKNPIDDEWSFVKSISGNIKHGYKIGGIKFCGITCTMVEQIEEFLVVKPQEIRDCTEGLEGDVSDIKFQLMSVGREWQGMFVEAREKITKCLIFAKSLKKDVNQWPDESGELTASVLHMKHIILSLRERIIMIIEEFQGTIDEAEEPKLENEKLAMRTRVREILHQAYRMGFDYHKEVCKLFLPEERGLLVNGLVDFAMLWMDFVKNRCERGRGLRPRWANHGLEYLMTVCEPLNTKYLSDEEFEGLKEAMDHCISHVVGDDSGSIEVDKRLPRSRATSPNSRSRTSSFSISSKSKDTLKDHLKDSLKTQEGSFRKSPNSSDTNLSINLVIPEKIEIKRERILIAIKRLESEIDEKRRGSELIGRIADRKSVDKIKFKVKRVTFTWQRGIKIGQGRFGKVYTVVNNQTGELLAMKEVALQPGDHRAVRRLVEELQIFEGIQHKHLVRYYGIEIQREEMLLFMEFCAEGTLESLVAGSGNGLPEIFVRKYTHQLLLAVSVLHSHGIVHRDIKTANIFLTDQGNCLKLGDFGCAVQIKAHTTMPGELQGFVGTQAYMAPEVFMKSGSGGHGRTADVWSVGCCVIEMAGGKRPWAEFDSNYQIMFKVGMGESPMPPKHLCKEGVDFASKCLTHDPKKRPTANSLLSHPFARNYDDVNVDLLTRVAT